PWPLLKSPGPSSHIALRQPVIMLSTGGGHPGHSFCANSPHCPNAPCAVPVIESLCASPSAQSSAPVHLSYGASPKVTRYWLIVSTQSCSAPAVDPPPEPPLVVLPLPPVAVRPLPLEPDVMSPTLMPQPKRSSAKTMSLSLTSIAFFMGTSCTPKKVYPRMHAWGQAPGRLT